MRSCIPGSKHSSASFWPNWRKSSQQRAATGSRASELGPVGNVAGPPTTQPQAATPQHPRARSCGRASIRRPGALVLCTGRHVALHASGWLLAHHSSVGATPHGASCSGWAPSQNCSGHHLLVRADRLWLEPTTDALGLKWQTTPQRERARVRRVAGSGAVVVKGSGIDNRPTSGSTCN